MEFKNVLFIAPNYKRRKGGIASVLTEYDKALDSINFLSSAYVSNKVLNFVLLPIALISFCVYLILNPQIKLIHIHGSFRGSFYRKYLFYWLAKTIFRKKVLYHIHGSEYHLFYKNASPRIKKYIEKMIDGIDGLIVLSVEWKGFFRKHFNQQNIYVLNNIVEYHEPFERTIPKENMTLLFLGRIGNRKGVFDLLEAVNKVQSKRPDKLKLTVGGDGEVDKLKQLISNYNLEGIVTYVGWVKGTKKIELLKESDILILPSYNEGLPIALLEGMSYSMPIISTNVGGIPQVLESFKNGIMVSPGNIEEIEGALMYYIDHKNDIISHGKEAYSRVANFFPQPVMKSLSEIYRQQGK